MSALIIGLVVFGACLVARSSASSSALACLTTT